MKKLLIAILGVVSLAATEYPHSDVDLEIRKYEKTREGVFMPYVTAGAGEASVISAFFLDFPLPQFGVGIRGAKGRFGFDTHLELGTHPLNASVLAYSQDVSLEEINPYFGVGIALPIYGNRPDPAIQLGVQKLDKFFVQVQYPFALMVGFGF